MKNISLLLKTYLQKNGIKVRKLAECIGLDEPQTYRFLHGRRSLTHEEEALAMKFMDGKWLEQVTLADLAKGGE